MRTAMLLGAPKVGRVADIVRARAQRPAVPPGTVGEVIRAVGGRVAGRPRNTAQGWRSEVVIVDTSRGTKVVKAYRPEWPFGSIEHEHSVLVELERLGFPSVRVCRTTDGAGIVEVSGRHMVVFDFVPGVNPSSMHIPATRRRSLLATAAGLLARLHGELAGFVPAGHHHLAEPVGAGSGWYVDTLESMASRRFVPPALASDHVALCGRWESIAERLVDLERRLQDTAFVDTVIHGDFGLHNLIFRTTDHATVHDFELARRQRRLVDVVVVMSRLEPGHRPAFVDAYRSAGTVHPDEWASLDIVWEEYRLRGAVRSWANALELGSTARIGTAMRRVREADSVREGAVTGWT